MPVIASTARFTAETSRFGELLRAWRDARKVSQLELSLQADMSQRHLSFLESGRSRPSREMVLQLSEALDIPLRERNTLLHAAGFASLYQERALDSGEMTAVREALDLVLTQQEPYPAVVVDRVWNVVRSNQATDRILQLLLGDMRGTWARVDPSGEFNLMRLIFHPQGLRETVHDWEFVATRLLARLQHEVAAYPANTRLRAVLEEVTGYPGVQKSWRSAAWTSPLAPVLPLEFRAGGKSLKLFSMLSTFGTAQDITADELRVELHFPADEETACFFRQLADA